MDLAEAFDTVAHYILLERLCNIGIRGLANDLIGSYLSGRTQRVRIADTISDSLQTRCGVPQGTVLGPLLFNIYINGIMSVLDEEKVYCFADDTVIIVCGQTWNSAINKAERAITKIKRWLDSSLLALNVEKTKFLAFGLTERTLPAIQKIKIHDYDCKYDADLCNCGCIIERKECIKYLGVLLDEKLTWKFHVNYITNKIRKLIYKFYELRQIMNIRTLKLVYFALVESIINYGLCVWGNAQKCTMASLHVAQKYIIKIILFKNRTFPTDSLFRESGLFNVEQMYIKCIIRFMITKPYYRIDLRHKINTRATARQNVIVPSVLCSATQRHIAYIGPKIYNVLPLDIRNKTYKQVKHKINRWIVESSLKLNDL